MKSTSWLTATAVLLIAATVAATALTLPSGGITAASPAMQAQPTPGPGPTGTVESPCMIDATKDVRPRMVRVGEQIGVTMTMRGICPNERYPILTVLVIDASESMAGEAMIETRRTATDLVRLMHLAAHPDDRVAVVAFNDAARTVTDLTNSEPQVLAGIRLLATTGGSHIELGLLEALRVLRNGSSGQTDPIWHIVLFSRAVRGAGTIDPRLEAFRAAAQVKAQGALLSTVCTSQGCDAEVMRQLASSPRYVFQAPTAAGRLADLQELLRDRLINVRFKQLAVAETLSDALGYVPDSATPAPLEPAGPASWRWETSFVPKDGLTHSYRASALAPGDHLVATTSRGVFVDNHGRSKAYDYPAVSVLVAPARGGLDAGPCSIAAEREIADGAVRIGQPVVVTTTLRIGCGPDYFGVHLIDVLPPDVEYVRVWDGAPEALGEGRRLEHRVPRDARGSGSGPWVFTYTHGVRALHAGAAVPISSDAYAGVVDLKDGADVVEVPAVTLEVLDEAWTPPATPPPTATPTATTPPRVERIFLPLMQRAYCRPAAGALDVVLVADLSPSMLEAAAPGGAAKLEMSREAMARLVDALPHRDDRVALVGCNGRARLEQALTGDRDAARAAVRGLAVQREGSVLSACLAAARAELGRAGTGRKVIALFTDGRADADARAAVAQQATLARSEGTVTAVLALGSEIDRAFLLAVTPTRAHHFQAATSDEARAAGARMAAAIDRAAVCP